MYVSAAARRLPDRDEELWAERRRAFKDSAHLHRLTLITISQCGWGLVHDQDVVAHGAVNRHAAVGGAAALPERPLPDGLNHSGSHASHLRNHPLERVAVL